MNFSPFLLSDAPTRCRFHRKERVNEDCYSLACLLVHGSILVSFVNEIKKKHSRIRVTEYFIPLEPQSFSIDELYVAQKRQQADFEALKFVKYSVGHV